MDIRLAVTVLGVLLCQVHGQPRAADEVGVSSSEDTKKIFPLQDFKTTEIKKIFPLQDFKTTEVKKIFPPQDFKTTEVKKIFPLQDFTTTEVKKVDDGKKEESPGKLKVPLTALGEKLKARLLEDSKLPTTSMEVQDEAVRSARQSPSPPFQQMSFGKGPHVTTVCIQVRSDHQPQVICGPQIGEREDQTPAPAAARFATPYDYGRAASQGRPTPGIGFPMRRSEQDLQPVDPSYQPASGPSPQNSLSPSRLNPPGPPGPVYVHRPYYEPVYSAGLMTPAQALMRLNCAVEPSGHLLNPQLVRGGALGYQDQQPLGQSVFTLPDGSPAKFGANVVSQNPIRTQNTFPVPQGQQQWTRSASEEDVAYLNSQMLRSPQSYPSSWSYGAYPEESPYLMDMMQGRSASGEDGYLAYPNDASTTDVYARQEYRQLQALRESQEKLRDIQEQLTSLKEQQDLQKSSPRNSSSSETSKDSSSPTGLSIDIKATPTKASKRQTRT